MEVVIVNSTILFYIHKNPADIRYYYILFNYLIFIKIKYFAFFQEEGTTNTRPDMKVPLAGDLLGRERVTGAKRVRMGCDLPEERYDNIVETPALWHAKQAFLKVSFKSACML